MEAGMHKELLCHDESMSVLAPEIARDCFQMGCDGLATHPDQPKLTAALLPNVYDSPLSVMTAEWNFPPAPAKERKCLY